MRWSRNVGQARRRAGAGRAGPVTRGRPRRAAARAPTAAAQRGERRDPVALLQAQVADAGEAALAAARASPAPRARAPRPENPWRDRGRGRRARRAAEAVTPPSGSAVMRDAHRSRAPAAPARPRRPRATRRPVSVTAPPAAPTAAHRAARPTNSRPASRTAPRRRAPRRTAKPGPARRAWPKSRRTSQRRRDVGPETTAPLARTVSPPSTATPASRSAERNWLDRDASTTTSPDRSRAALDRERQTALRAPIRDARPGRAQRVDQLADRPLAEPRRAAEQEAARAPRPRRPPGTAPPCPSPPRRARSRGRTRRAAGPRPAARPAVGDDRRAHGLEAAASAARVVALERAHDLDRDLGRGPRARSARLVALLDDGTRTGPADGPRRAGARGSRSRCATGETSEVVPSSAISIQRRSSTKAGRISTRPPSKLSVQDLWKWPSSRTSIPVAEALARRTPRIISTGSRVLCLKFDW